MLLWNRICRTAAAACDVTRRARFVRFFVRWVGDACEAGEYWAQTPAVRIEARGST